MDKRTRLLYIFPIKEIYGLPVHDASTTEIRTTISLSENKYHELTKFITALLKRRTAMML